MESTQDIRMDIGIPVKRQQWRWREGIEKYLRDKINRILVKDGDKGKGGIRACF